MAGTQTDERMRYSVDSFDFENEVLPYLNSAGRGEINGDSSVTFYMNDGGIIVLTEFENNGDKTTLLVSKCSQKVHDKLAELCND